MALGLGAALSLISYAMHEAFQPPGVVFVYFVAAASAVILASMMVMRMVGSDRPNRSREWTLAIITTLAFMALMAAWAAIVPDSQRHTFDLHYTGTPPWWMPVEPSQVTKREVLVRGWQLGFVASAVGLFLATNPNRRPSN